MYSSLQINLLGVCYIGRQVSDIGHSLCVCVMFLFILDSYHCSTMQLVAVKHQTVVCKEFIIVIIKMFLNFKMKESTY